MPDLKTPSCWICGDAADSAEHVFKAKDLRRMFDQDGYEFEHLPFHYSDRGHARISGPKSARVKYPALICHRCNNERTAPADRAYDRLSEHLAASQENGGTESLDLFHVFGSRWPDEVKLVQRYFAKSLGCRIVASGALLPDYFPNPVSGDHMELLVISICRAQPFRAAPNYEQNMFTSFLGKGSLYANILKSHLDRTGQRKVNNALWWENIGHFQINYWFGIRPNLQLGEALDGSRIIYRLPAVDHDLRAMNQLMSFWLSSADALYSGSDRLAYPLAKATWAGYLAARHSSISTPLSSAQASAYKLGEAIEKTKSAIDAEVLSYRTHGDLDRVLSLAQRDATSLITTAAQVQGYLDGCNTPLHILSPRVAEVLERSYFASTWQAVQPVLMAVHASFIAEPQGQTAFPSELIDAMLRYYDSLGLVIKSMPEGQCYVEIPFRPSNSTSEMITRNGALSLSDP
jgi:hypothetical protein